MRGRVYWFEDVEATPPSDLNTGSCGSCSWTLGVNGVQNSGQCLADHLKINKQMEHLGEEKCLGLRISGDEQSVLMT